MTISLINIATQGGESLLYIFKGGIKTMTTLSVDIETHSDFDLRKTGAHRYVEAPDFEILIIAYSIDGGEVESIDMYDIDEQLYKEFRGLLFDP